MSAFKTGDTIQIDGQYLTLTKEVVIFAKLPYRGQKALVGIFEVMPPSADLPKD